MAVKKVFMIPAKGGRVRKEGDVRSFVKEVGEKLPLTIYYRRRIRRGELVFKVKYKKPEIKSEKSKE